MCLQESIPVGCQPPACQPYVIHNEQECIPVAYILTDGQTQLKILPSLTKDKLVVKQDCIPVGCVPSAEVAVSPATHTCMPPCHVCLPHHTPLPCIASTMHAPLPHMPLPCHASPLLPHMPPVPRMTPCHTRPPCEQKHRQV